MVRLTLIGGILRVYRFDSDRKTLQTLLHCHNQCMQMIEVIRKFVAFELLDTAPIGIANKIGQNQLHEKKNDIRVNEFRLTLSAFGPITSITFGIYSRKLGSLEIWSCFNRIFHISVAPWLIVRLG